MDGTEMVVDDRGLVIDRKVLEALGMPEGTVVEVRAAPDGRGLTVVPAADRSTIDHERRILESARYVTEKHRETLAKLAE